MSLRYGTILLLAAVWTAPLRGQESTGTVTGRVTDQVSQQPIRGANVTLAGKAAQSRDDGRYVLTGVPAGTDTLRVTLIGFAPLAREVTVSTGQVLELDLPMNAQALNLSEMVVVGYGEQAAGNITGAVTQVSAEEFNKGRIVSPTELIQNKAAGVQVVENNEPGGGTSIRIRGATSVNASSEPLYVIDGVPIGTGAGGGIVVETNQPDFLNPNPGERYRQGSRSAQLPEPRRHREHHRAARRFRRGDLRRQRRQRRGADHDQERRATGPPFEYSGTCRLRGSPGCPRC